MTTREARRSSGSGERRAKAGCILTFENSSGERRTLNRYGPPLEVVREMCTIALKLDDSYRVISYSTPETILSDMDGARADRAGTASYNQRATLPERALLGRLRLVSMLHPRLVLTSDPRKLASARARRAAR